MRKGQNLVSEKILYNFLRVNDIDGVKLKKLDNMSETVISTTDSRWFYSLCFLIVSRLFLVAGSLLQIKIKISQFLKKFFFFAF